MALSFLSSPLLPSRTRRDYPLQYQALLESARSPRLAPSHSETGIVRSHLFTYWACLTYVRARSLDLAHRAPHQSSLNHESVQALLNRACFSRSPFLIRSLFIFLVLMLSRFLSPVSPPPSIVKSLVFALFTPALHRTPAYP